MNSVNFYTYPVSATTGTALKYVGQSDVLQLFVPNVASNFGSSPTEIRIRGSYSSAVTALTASFYDYPNKTNAECVITITTAGVYEIPNAGGPPFISLQWDKAATQATSVYLIASRITY